MNPARNSARYARVTTRSLGPYLALLASAILVLLISPLALLGVRQLYPFLEWTALSEVGQSYTGIAALLSGGALVGLAYSVRLQGRQVRIMQLQAVRTMQFDIFALGISNANLNTNDPPEGLEEGDRFARSAYLTMFIRYLQFAYLSAEMPEHSLRSALRDDLFRQPRFQRHWRMISALWELRAYTPDEKRFVRILQEEHRRVMADIAHSGDDS